MVEVRVMGPEDMDGIFRVRVAVHENAMSTEQLRDHSITPESTARLLGDAYKGWVALDGGEVVAFSVADRKTQSIWAMFVLPGHEGRGIGRRLMGPAVAWLWDCGAERLWLNTGPATRAAGFYRRLGWREAGLTDRGEMRFELDRPG